MDISNQLVRFGYKPTYFIVPYQWNMGMNRNNISIHDYRDVPVSPIYSYNSKGYIPYTIYKYIYIYLYLYYIIVCNI